MVSEIIEKEEIKDTYIIGDNSSQEAVLDIHISQNYIYTDNGEHTLRN